jgi:hypothetical protein
MMTNMIQVWIFFRGAREIMINTRPDEIIGPFLTNFQLHYP